MKWVHVLNNLTTCPTEEVQKLAGHRLISYAFCSRDKGGVQFAADSAGKVVGYTIKINPDQTRAECEVTLLHELFHLFVGTHHPKGQSMMQHADQLLYRFVEAEIDAAAYRYQALYPVFVRELYDRHISVLCKKTKRQA